MTPTSLVHAIDSEAALIGMAMVDREGCSEAFDRLRPGHFSEPLYGAAWEAMRAGPADPVLLHNRLAHLPAMEMLGGIGHLADLVINAPPTSRCVDYADDVLDAHTRRQVLEACKDAQAGCVQAGQGSALTASLERRLADIARDGEQGSSTVSLGLTALETFEAAARGEYRGTETGLACLDRITGGIKTDDVWVVGGRSSMGKSIVGIALALNIARQNRGVVFWSLEMGLREVQARAIADVAHDFYGNVRVRYADILQGKVPPNLTPHARDAAKRLASLPFQVSDASGLTIEDIRARSRRQIRAWERAGIKPGLVVIDHLGLVAPIERTGNKAADTADTVNELKGVAKQLGCPVLALAQVNRGPEQRNDKHPTMADLNWSGSIEQIADFVCLLYRQSYYDERSSEADIKARADLNKHDIELLIQKNRSGPTCTLKAWVDVASNALRDQPGDERGAA